MSDNDNSTLANAVEAEEKTSASTTQETNEPEQPKFSIKEILANLKTSSIMDMFLPIKYMEYGLKCLLVLSTKKIQGIMATNIFLHLTFLLLSFIPFTRVKTISILISFIFSFIFYNLIISWKKVKANFKIDLSQIAKIKPINLTFKKIYKPEEIDKLKNRYK